MKPFRLITVAGPAPHPDLLHWVYVRDAIAVSAFHEDFISPQALRSYEKWTQQTLKSQNFVQDPRGESVYFTGGTHLLKGAQLAEEFDYALYMEIVGDHILASDIALTPIHAGRHCTVLVVRESHVRPELVRDYNMVRDWLPLRGRTYRKPVTASRLRKML